ncbi:MAG TPA: hypothetical protein VGO96_10125 [Pyrinomonadaceae bacterium]|nr:hypothetical protein [Pyrinomonadaceae bacterium]
MNIILNATLAALCLVVPANVPVQENAAATPAMKQFWSKFQNAVAKNDRDAVAAMSKFPLLMPYGVPSIKTRAQLIRRYGEIFDAETRKCFATAQPQVDDAKAKKFSINCGEAMMYWFEFSGGTYKFASVDNVNE